MVSCESQSHHHNGEPQGAPSRKNGEGKGNDDDDDNDDVNMYRETTQVWSGSLTWAPKLGSPVATAAAGGGDGGQQGIKVVKGLRQLAAGVGGGHN